MTNTMRNKIEEAKNEYIRRYGSIGNGFGFKDEILPWTIQAYHGSVGSVMGFTADDWLACKENGWSLDDVCILCNEPWLCENTDTLASFLGMIMEDWKQRTENWNIADEKADRDCILGAGEDFFTWRRELLPIAVEIYRDG